MGKIKKYIDFNLVEYTKKTQVYCIRSINTSIILGYIKWYGAWRQYCFLPEGNTVFSVGCLRDIWEFINDLMEEKRCKL